MPPHSLFEPVQSVRLCRVQSHATSQSLTSLFGWCTTLPCSEPCHLTVSYEPVRLVYDSAVFRAMPPHSLLRACSKCTTLLCSEPCHLTVSYEPVRLVYDSAMFRAMPPHSLLRACEVRRIRRIAQYKKCLVHASMTSHFLYCAAWL